MSSMSNVPLLLLRCFVVVVHSQQFSLGVDIYLWLVITIEINVDIMYVVCC